MAIRKYIDRQLKNTEVGRQLTIFSHDKGIPVVSSRTVHEVFNKRHDNVLADITNLIEKVERSKERTGNLGLLEFEETNFIKSTYVDQWNREQPEYLLTRDGFTLLAMGYDDNLKR